jgi:hypothetical protein
MILLHQKITPYLWFDAQAEEAATFYTSIFKNSRIVSMTRYGEAGHDVHGRPAGTVMVVAFELEGQAFTVLNGGRCSHLTRPSRSRSVVRRRKNWTIIGGNSLQAAMSRPNRAAGSKTGMACPDKWFPPCCLRCSRTPMRKNPNAS